MMIQDLNRGQLQNSTQFLAIVMKVGMTVDLEIRDASHDLI
jgi:hypothetical protein